MRGLVNLQVAVASTVTHFFGFGRGLAFRLMSLACGNVFADVWPEGVSGAAHLTESAEHA